MRIGTYNMISQIYGSTSTKKSNNTNSTSYASFRDEVSFSSMGKDMQIAKNALRTAPDVRESLVNDIKARISNGTYEVSNEDFAAKLMDAYASR
ncbi:MAG: flagellar biosynthesis anti-sigma factor FlgM [Lachnospiraceae bacterium]|nr:flagellar biosynthesis anti-sigma factor FlgM [Lachnospiraceae bacterium]